MTIYLLTAIEFRPGGSSYDTMQPTSFTAFTSVSESHLIGKKSTDKIHLTFESITISINPWWRRQWFSEIKCTQDLKLSKWCTTKSSAISNLHWINMSNLHHVTPPPWWEKMKVVGEDEIWGIISIWRVKLVFGPTETRKKGLTSGTCLIGHGQAVVTRKLLLLSLIGATT